MVTEQELCLIYLYIPTIRGTTEMMLNKSEMCKENIVISGGEFHGHGSPASCRPRGPKESDTTEPLN